MTIGDVQRQTSRSVSPKTIKKLSNPSYIKRVLRAYSNLQSIYAGISTDGKINHTMRYGLPKQDTTYIIRRYDELQKFIKQHKTDKPKSVTRKVADKLSAMVFKHESYRNPTKAQRYGLTIPSSLKVEPVIRNGERTNIPLSEVLN